MVLNYCFYKIHQLLIIVNVNNKQKPFTHPTVNPFFNDYSLTNLNAFVNKNFSIISTISFLLDICYNHKRGKMITKTTRFPIK